MMPKKAKREPQTVAEVLDAVSNGTIGHEAAIKALGVADYAGLVETMRYNGRTFWAHRPVAPDPALITVLGAACGVSPARAKAAAERASKTRQRLHKTPP